MKPEIAQPLSLMLHELATSAARYGPLPRQDGMLRVGWALGRNGWLQVRWSERGGAPLAGAPARRGFGFKLADRVTRAQPHGTLAVDWGAEGPDVLLAIPLPPPSSARAPDAVMAEG